MNEALGFVWPGSASKASNPRRPPLGSLASSVPGGGGVSGPSALDDDHPSGEGARAAHPGLGAVDSATATPPTLSLLPGVLGRRERSAPPPGRLGSDVLGLRDDLSDSRRSAAAAGVMATAVASGGGAVDSPPGKRWKYDRRGWGCDCGRKASRGKRPIGCLTDACACRSANRECDPELCAPCFATGHDDAQRAQGPGRPLRSAKGAKHTCRICQIQLGCRKVSGAF